MAKIDALFQELINRGGSDLHLAEGQPPKIRIHGDITAIRDEPLTRVELDPMLQKSPETVVGSVS